MTQLRGRLMRLEQQSPIEPEPAVTLTDEERFERARTLLSQYAEAPDSMSDLDHRRASGLLTVFERVGARALTENPEQGDALLAFVRDVRNRVEARNQ